MGAATGRDNGLHKRTIYNLLGANARQIPLNSYPLDAAPSPSAIEAARMTREQDFSEAVRQEALRRARGRCEGKDCAAAVYPLAVDHIKEVWENGTNTLDNAQALCRACHRVKTREATKRRAKADRQRKAILGRKKPPRRPIPGSKASPWKKTFTQGWVRRNQGKEPK